MKNLLALLLALIVVGYSTLPTLAQDPAPQQPTAEDLAKQKAELDRFQRNARWRRHVIRHKEIRHQVLAGIDAVLVEIHNAILGQECVVDQEVAAEASRLAQDMPGGIGDDLGLAAMGKPLLARQDIADGGGGDGGARPERVEGDAVRAELLGHAQHAQAHAELGDRVGDMRSKPARLDVQRRRERENVRILPLHQLRMAGLGTEDRKVAGPDQWSPGRIRLFRP